MLVVPKPDGLDTCFAVDNHYDFDEGHRTVAGSLVYRAKDYGEDGPGEVDAADRLARIVAYWACWVSDQRRWGGPSPDLVVPVPSGRQRRPHNLPDVLAGEVARQLDIELDPSALVKALGAPQIKTVIPAQRRQQLRGMFDAQRVKRRRVLVIDDLIQTGATLSAAAEAFHRAEASSVVGLVATRVQRGLA